MPTRLAGKTLRMHSSRGFLLIYAVSLYMVLFKFHSLRNIILYSRFLYGPFQCHKHLDALETKPRGNQASGKGNEAVFEFSFAKTYSVEKVNHEAYIAIRSNRSRIHSK